MGGFLDFLSYIIPITGVSVIDSFLFLIIGFIAFAVAWAVGGAVKGDSDTKSCAHRIVRVVVFLGLLGLASGVAWLIKLILSIKWWVWIIIGVSLAHIIVGIVLIIKYRKKRKKTKDQVQ